MPRGPRLDAPGVVQHVMARGIDRCLIFRDDRDRADLLDRLASATGAGGVRVYAWSLMPNHFHLLTRTGASSVSRVMQAVTGGYARRFNERHNRCGHLFQNRFKSCLVHSDAYLLELVRYIHGNPLRAGIVVSLDALGTYPWTGHATLTGTIDRRWQDTAAVLALFGDRVGAARRRLMTFMRDGMQRGATGPLSEVVLRANPGGLEPRPPQALGREAWRFDERVVIEEQDLPRMLAEFDDTQETVAVPKLPREALDRRLRAIADTHRVHLCEIAGAGKRPGAVRGRSEFCAFARLHGGWSVMEIARYLGVSRMAVHRALLRARRSSG